MVFCLISLFSRLTPETIEITTPKKDSEKRPKSLITFIWFPIVIDPRKAEVATRITAKRITE